MNGRQVSRLVSVIVPVRNVRAHLEGFCLSVLGQILPDDWSLELILADARSSDGTRELLRVMCLREPRVRWVDNPRRTEASGLNAALRAAAGDVIVRMDVLTDYSADYIHQALRVLGESGADRVGGPWRVRPVVSTDPMQCALAAVAQAMGSANAESSSADFNGWVNTVYSGCWPRSTFERFGAFDDRMARLQDDEYDLRIARGGGLIWQSSRLRSVCRVETSLSTFFRAHLRAGYWKPFVIKKHGKLPALTRYGPVWALLLASLSALLSLLTWSVWPLVLAVLVGLVALGLSLSGVWRGQASIYGWPVLLRLPLVVGAYHAGRGLGFLLGVWALLRRRKLGLSRHQAALNGRA